MTKYIINSISATSIFRKVNKSLYYILGILAVSFSLLSCERKDEPDPGNKNIVRAVLVYAVNNNNLNNYFDNNCNQMLIAAGNINLDEAAVYVYSKSAQGALLKRIVKNNNKATFKVVKEYDGVTLSTDPARFSSVINDFINQTPQAVRTIMFWGHGMGWSPFFSTHDPSDITPGPIRPSISNPGDLTAFGGEGGYPRRDWLDIKEIEENIPEDAFNTIWFDACYMSSIEVMYQLRNKAKFIVASPTEVAGQGLNYDKALPYILSETPDYPAALDAFYNYYNESGLPATGAVVKTALLEDVAVSASKIFSPRRESVSWNGITNYSRDSNWPYIDLMEYAAVYGETRSDSDALIDEFKSKIETALIYKIHTRYDFKYNVLPETICCISVAPQPTDNSANSTYYRTLDWYKAVYK